MSNFPKTSTPLLRKADKYGCRTKLSYYGTDEDDNNEITIKEPIICENDKANQQ